MHDTDSDGLAKQEIGKWAVLIGVAIFVLGAVLVNLPQPGYRPIYGPCPYDASHVCRVGFSEYATYPNQIPGIAIAGLGVLILLAGLVGLRWLP